MTVPGRLLPSFLPQALLGAGAMMLMAFAPPEEGQMTIVSLTGESGDQIARWGLEADVALVGTEAHSLTVVGRRAGLFWQALRHGALVVAARPQLCGAEIPA